MIPIICINDKNRPNEIPAKDWVKEGETYHVTHVSIQVNQMENGNVVTGCDIYEKPLSFEKHAPYECFRLDRFGCTKENMEALMQLMIDCYHLPKDYITQLLEESELQQVND